MRWGQRLGQGHAFQGHPEYGRLRKPLLGGDDRRMKTGITSEYPGMRGGVVLSGIMISREHGGGASTTCSARLCQELFIVTRPTKDPGIGAVDKPVPMAL